MVEYDFYSTCWRGDRNTTTSFIKIISNSKPWEILFITCYTCITIFRLTELFSSILDTKIPIDI